VDESNRSRLMRDGARRKLDRLRNTLGKSYFGLEERPRKAPRREAQTPPVPKQP
jgi:hypothetical protein